MQITVTDSVRSRLRVRSDLPPPKERVGLRRAAELTQQELADAIGVTRAALSLWELGRRTPRGQLLDRYVEALRALREAA